MYLTIAVLLEIINTYIIRICFQIDRVDGIILVLITMIIFLIWILTNKKITKNQRTLLLLAYLIRIVIILIRQTTKISIMYTGGDADGFNLIGEKIASNIILLKENMYGGFYTKILGILYYLIGTNRLFAENINILYAMGIFYNVFLIINQCDVKNNLKKNLLEIILVFLPHGILLSASLLREMIIGLFVILSLRYCINYIKFRSKKYIVLCFASIIVGAIFHAGVIFLIVGYVLVISFYSFKEEKIDIDAKKIIVFSIFTILLITFYVKYGNTFAGKIYNVDLESRLESESKGGSAYLGGKEINSIADIIIYSIPKTIYFLFSPMPWDFRGISDIVSFTVDSLIYFYLLYNIVKTRKNLSGGRKEIINLLLIGLLSTIFVFALGVSNAGTAMRHRYKLFPYILTMTILCTCNQKEETKT